MTLLDTILLIIAFVAFIQIFFQLFFHSRLLYFSPKKSPEYSTHTPVSVIVAARNELENLKKLLPVLQKQNYPTYEIIIIDDRSSDGTYEFLYEARKEDSRLKIVHIEHTPDHISHKKYAITLGVRAAQYEHLVFVDADCLPASNNWLAWIAGEFTENKEFVLGVSPYLKQKGVLNWIIRYETFFTAIQYISYALAKLPYMGVGRNLAYKKEVFIRNKGFHQHLKIVGGDDDLFVNQCATGQNTGVCIQPEAHVYSYPKTTWKSWFVQKNRHLSVGKFYKRKFKFLLGLQNLTHVLFWLLLPVSVGVGLFFWQEIVLFHCFLIVPIFLRLFSWSIFQYFATKKMKFQSSWLSWWLFDCVYVFFIVILGVKAFFSKPEQWI
jgi:glycosyltransferase involved in cell wall biosynthesis